MTFTFNAKCYPTLIGSLPMDSHPEAAQLVLAHTPEIPLWVQLPTNFNEGMMVQFLEGLPGLVMSPDKMFVNTAAPSFETDLLAFYEDYLSVTEGDADLSTSRFATSPEVAPGFYEMLRQLESTSVTPLAVKGQITGPFTIGTGTADENGRAIFYDDRLSDVMTKLLAQKARWQVRQMAALNLPVILFFDEPALTGFGSSAFISISKEAVAACFAEVIDAVHTEGGLAGVHVCANAEWSLILDSPADILSFDAYAYFDRLLLYRDALKAFLDRGGILAWGIVPTLNAEDLEKETAASLIEAWWEKVDKLTSAGIDRQKIIDQALITPACGTGSLTLEQATRVLRLTAEVSREIRNTLTDA